jgi:hypothetical protein
MEASAYDLGFFFGALGIGLALGVALVLLRLR